MVVPELPQSNTLSGSFSPCNPLPFINRMLFLSCIFTPRFFIHLQVDWISSACSRFLITLSPRAKAEKITARCDIDLSAATVISPLSGFALEIFLSIPSIPLYCWLNRCGLQDHYFTQALMLLVNKACTACCASSSEGTPKRMVPPSPSRTRKISMSTILILCWLRMEPRKPIIPG